MEGVKKWFSEILKDAKLAASNASSSVEGPRATEGLSAALSSSDQTRIIVSRPVRGVVSLWTCSKFCALCFVAGIIVGYTLKRRVKRWANKALRRLKDD